LNNLIKNVAIWLVIALVLMTVFNQFNTRQAAQAPMDYSQFIEEVKAGRVSELPESFADPRMAELRKRLGELEATYSQLNVTFGPKHPRVIEATEQIATIKRQLEDSRKSLEDKLKADYERSIRDEGSLGGALSIAKSEAARARLC
jgi:uncharacterized protein involved in exopolysaccharide biosynthesis